jgi:glycine/D-amino acid oxidase-like deaminating enzyme
MENRLGSSEPWDAVVIGGGFYGATLALELRHKLSRVALVEREMSLMKRASYSNQARVHNGYHYPRSILTALRSRQSYERFCQDYPDAISRDFTQVYAVARRLSKVNAQQYERFCRRIGADIYPAPKEIRALFDEELIEAAFVVRESAFDAVAIARVLDDSLERNGVKVTIGCEAESIEAGSPNLVHVRDVSTGENSVIRSSNVFNCTYSATNRILEASSAPLFPLRHELAELALVEVPEHLKHVGITVMDGPFFSVMPFPATGHHSFSHVRYTPHLTWTESEAAQPVIPKHGASSFPHMLRDAIRYVPSLAGTRYVHSLWETKTILPNRDRDDSRPALIQRAGGANVWSIVGAKIDGIYDVLESVDEQLNPSAARTSA